MVLPFWLGVVFSIDLLFIWVFLQPAGGNPKARSFWDSVVQKVSKPKDNLEGNFLLLGGSQYCYFLLSP